VALNQAPSAHVRKSFTGHLLIAGAVGLLLAVLVGGLLNLGV